MKIILCLALILLTFLSRAQDLAVLAAKPTMHQKCAASGVSLELRGLYMQGGLLWLVLRASNRSAIDFRPAVMHITIRDKHSLRRTALQELRLEPVFSNAPATLKADSSTLICYAVKPRVPRPHQQLILTWGDRNGDRRLEMTLKANAIIHAKPIK